MSKKNLNKVKNWRRCISCRHFAPKQNFWRIVRVYPSHQIQLDQGMGRSAYVCPTAECLALAKKKKSLARSLKTNIPDNIHEQLWQKLELWQNSNNRQ